MKLTEMTKIFLATLGMGLGASTFAAPSQNGIVKLQGTIYSSTCTVTVNDQLLGNGTPIVNMGRYSTSSFGNTGSIVGGKNGNGELKVVASDCPDSGTVKMKFSGTAVSTDGNVLAIDSDGGKEAQNLGIIIYQGKDLNNPLAINKEYIYNLTGGDNKEYVQDFRAAYVSTADTVTAGSANSTMNVNMEYN
ncbi:fimbrial protein [Acinetobacter pullicarnis]|uniref:fimbrial protein n=1 Tax=Acinetobacter pullicarnis TaxID=2576829 RepID=UPI001121DE29|nr:fimbrial protein [Acinetobacter pullicarnis]